MSFHIDFKDLNAILIIILALESTANITKCSKTAKVESSNLLKFQSTKLSMRD